MVVTQTLISSAFLDFLGSSRWAPVATAERLSHWCGLGCICQPYAGISDTKLSCVTLDAIYLAI